MIGVKDIEILLNVVRLLAVILIAFLTGKLISKLKLPSVLGWLIAGMVIGLYAFNLLSDSVLDAQWFDVMESICECIFGLMISVLGASASECASIIQGAIAAATVINEIIAVFMVKKGFEWIGELNKAEGGQTA